MPAIKTCITFIPAHGEAERMGSASEFTLTHHALRELISRSIECSGKSISRIEIEDDGVRIFAVGRGFSGVVYERPITSLEPNGPKNPHACPAVFIERKTG